MRWWEALVESRSVVVPVILFPCGFVGGLLAAPVLYFLTNGDFWKSLGGTLIGLATLGILLGSLFGVTDVLSDWADHRPMQRLRLRMPKPVIRRASSTRTHAAA
jgi:uncharacterized membrane protein